METIDSLPEEAWGRSYAYGVRGAILARRDPTPAEALLVASADALLASTRAFGANRRFAARRVVEFLDGADRRAEADRYREAAAPVSGGRAPADER